VTNECPEPTNKYDSPAGSVTALMTEESGKHMYKNPFADRDGPWYTTIYPSDAFRFPILGAVSNDTVLNLIKEAAQFKRAHQ
jgi:hypothetical protein